jgi:hypothetical protein
MTRARPVAMLAIVVCISIARADDAPPAAPKGFTLRPTVAIQTAGFGEVNTGWGTGKGFFGPVGESWMELAVTPGFEGSYGLPSGMSVVGRVSGAFTFTGGGLDAAGSNIDPRQPNDFLLEDGYLGWRSGDLLPGIGKDALEISGGAQQYRIGSGFLMWTGATNGGPRGAYWIAARQAFQFTGLARLKTRGLLWEAFYLRPNDQPYTSTDVTGTNIEYELAKPIVVDALTLGFTYLKIPHSQEQRRDGLNVFDLRGSLKPLTVLPNLQVTAETTLEENGRQVQDAYAWYVEPAYQVASLPWKPRLGYRYAFFRGETPGAAGNASFDPLFYGLSDWGTWFQGEIFGEYQSINSNLVVNMVRLTLTPSETLILNALYFNFRLDQLPTGSTITSKNVGNEVNLTADWSPIGQLTISAVYAFNVPGAATEQATNGSAVWSHFMLYMGISL